ncbi:hypothetical protein H8A97_13075 [Bradyrhizobium sp. Arg62]|uniref:hypothetical protein n=1 Tax=Bradyrhizobium brasilense TaxID=1419277 RepID=UPI001E29BBEF|nr:hypothetical protein [Bradyrhizobium brasilense]MCC8946006.1 hypothetical protein [Bradyrhizobium brasilense]
MNQLVQAANVGAKFDAGLDAAAAANIGMIRMKSTYRFECFDADGNLKWEETVDNLVVNVGLNDLLSNYFKGSSYTAAFYVGLKDAGTVAAGDTMSSHSGWTEDTSYSNSTRPALTLGSVSGQSVDNSASKAVFTINGTATIAGAFVTTSSTKGGTTGVLYGAADFGAARSVLSGDTLNLTVTLTATGT